MKNLFFSILILLAYFNTSLSQIPFDYPFKTLIYDQNILFVVGYFEDYDKNIMCEKYVGQNRIYSKNYFNNGEDKAYDLAVDFSNPEVGLIYVTGYIFNSQSQSNDIVIIKYDDDRFNQNPIWTRTFGNQNADDKGYGIAYDAEDNSIYVTGYVSNNTTSKDYILLKYDASGNMLWSRQYNNYSRDDVATDVLIDAGFVYVIGYSYQDATLSNDIMLLTYEKATGNFSEELVLRTQNRDEKPTSFILTEISSDRRMKSRGACTGYQDNIILPGLTDRNIITIFFDGGYGNSIRWSRTFGTAPGEDAGTAIAKNTSNDVIITGYSDHSPFSYDFTTIKYDKDDGSLLFTGYYDVSGGSDKATSVAVQGTMVVVSGPSVNSITGYETVRYRDNGSSLDPLWDRIFMPSYVGGKGPGRMNHASSVGIDPLGNITTFTFGWNSASTYYAAVKYDSLGNELYVIDEGNDSKDVSLTKNNGFSLTRNYPNPFNPVTTIEYSIPDKGLVLLKIFDLSGREVYSAAEYKNEGTHRFVFDGSEFAGGVYFFKLQSGSYSSVMKMLLVK